MTTILKSGILRILQSNGCREESECFLSMMRNEVKNRKALEGVLMAVKEAHYFLYAGTKESVEKNLEKAIAAGEEALK